MDRKFKILAVIFVVVLVLITFAVSYQLLILEGEASVNPPMPTGSPNNESENAQSLRLSVKLLQNSQESLEFNITQGRSITINIAFSSLSKNHFTIPLYLSAGSFEGQRLSQLITSPPAPYPTVPSSIYDESSNPSELFEANFTVNPLMFEPNENKTTDLTITALQDADIGEYAMLLEMGSWEQTGLSAITFKIRVMPNQ
jgi:hypothetical protein